MTETVENIVVEQLKALRNDIREFRQANTEEHADLKARLSHLEAVVLTIKRNDLETASETARQQISIDQIMQRIERIERRLELAN